MYRLLVVACLAASALARNEKYDVCYNTGHGNPASCMAVDVDDLANTISYHMQESDEFEDVATLEDYNVGLAASRVPSQDACFVRRLLKNFGQQVSFIQSFNGDLTVDETPGRVDAIPMDNPEEEMGSLLAEFCGDLPVYKLVEHQDTEEPEARQVAITFRRCVLFCFVPVCYSTTLTLPTGNTITFGWLILG